MLRLSSQLSGKSRVKLTLLLRLCATIVSHSFSLLYLGYIRCAAFVRINKCACQDDRIVPVCSTSSWSWRPRWRRLSAWQYSLRSSRKLVICFTSMSFVSPPRREVIARSHNCYLWRSLPFQFLEKKPWDLNHRDSRSKTSLKSSA